jgi:DNA-binding NarL/FixJ family response regulator
MRVLMIDDHRLLAEAIRIALEASGFHVVGIEATAEAGMRALREDPCDMALVDVGLPDESGIDLGRRILAELPGVRVVALTGFLDAASMNEAVGAGFHGYLTKDTPLTELVAYLRSVGEGQVVGPRRAMTTAFVDPRSPGEIVAERLAAQLTSREREVLTFLAEARGGDSIAEILSISANTVRTHVQNIMAKLEVHSRLEAVAFAIRYGVVQTARTGAHAPLRVAS